MGTPFHHRKQKMAFYWPGEESLLPGLRVLMLSVSCVVVPSSLLDAIQAGS